MRPARTHTVAAHTAALFAAVFLSGALVCACGSSGTGSSGGSSPSPSASQVVTRDQVVALVDTTCAAVQQDAPATFAAIDAGEAPYVDPADPALYAFVFDGSVTLVADPDPELRGKSLRGVPDATGKCFRDVIVCGAFADGSGWVDYVKEKPGDAALYRKTSYYRLVTGSDGKEYAVGAGMYLGPWEGSPSPSPSATAAQPTRAQVKAFVDEAWRHARQVGKEQAIADFMDTSGPWYRDGLYVFANDADGVVLCLPTDPSRLGEDRWDAQDPDGTYFVRELVDTAMDEGAGWVTYVYTNPDAGYALQDKNSYVRRVDDTWYVGAGTYAAAAQAVTREDVIAFVERAARHVRDAGETHALADFSDPGGGFRDGELYIFAEDFQGNELASGGQPELVGTNIIDAQDSNGVYLVRELIATARDKGRGWVSYQWDNPATGEIEDKLAYVIKAGHDWYVGSGMYVE